jgi:hypothetical protein
MLQAVDACMSWVNNRAEGHAPLTVQAPGEMLGIYSWPAGRHRIADYAEWMPNPYPDWDIPSRNSEGENCL